jgi:hypothetical protein
MDHSQTKETICNHCSAVFPSKGKYQYHFQRVHQNEVKITHSNEEEMAVHRSEDGKFSCICDKGYHSGQSLYRHQKGCQQWKTHVASDRADSDSDESIQGDFYILFHFNF